MTKQFVTLVMMVLTMLLLGIYNFKIGEYTSDYYCGNNPYYVRITDEDDVQRYTASSYYDERKNIVWNFDYSETNYKDTVEL